jgi:hypothetical protein
VSVPTNPITAAFNATPRWMLSIRDFDEIEVHPCCVVGFADGLDIVETCDREDAHFWSVYGHYRTGGLDCFEDFGTEAEADAFAEQLRHTYPHLAGRVRA